MDTNKKAKYNFELVQKLKCIITGIVLLFVTPGFAQTDWYTTFKTTYPNMIPTVPYLGWSESYTMRAYISMYRAAVARGESQAEQQKWLTYLTTHCSYVINNNLTDTDALVKAAHGYTPIARFVRMVFDDDTLYSSYGSLANTYLNYIETVIIPHWRNYPYWKDPFNWYSAYGCLLLNLQQVTRSPHYHPPFYQSPDTSLAAYYQSSILNITNNYFRDFEGWDYTGPNWQWADMNLPTKGLCYVPSPADAYIWRYWDEGNYPTFSGSDTQHVSQGAQITEAAASNLWNFYRVTRLADSVKLQMYDSTGNNLLYENTAPWDSLFMFTNADLYIGRQPNSPYSSYFEGILDEIKFYKNNNLVAWLPFEGNTNDSTGNGHNGTITGSPTFVPGKSGQGLEFHYDYVKVPDHPDLNNFDKLELWAKIYPTSPKYYNYFLGKSGRFPDSTGYNLYIDAYRRAEDIGHANLEIEFLTEIYCDSLFSSSYSSQQMQRFANTFTKILWSNTDVNNPVFRGWLDPTAPDNDDHTTRWLWLYKYDSLIGHLVSKWYENHTAYWFEEPLANLACWQAGLFVDDCEQYTTSVPGLVTGSGRLIIYPNPSTNLVTISIVNKNYKDLTMNIYSVLGNLIMTESLKQDQKQINVAELANGIYVIEIKSKEWTEKQKLIIQR
jgi:hypothetical protein